MPADRRPAGALAGVLGERQSEAAVAVLLDGQRGCVGAVDVEPHALERYPCVREGAFAACLVDLLLEACDEAVGER